MSNYDNKSNTFEKIIDYLEKSYLEFTSLGLYTRIFIISTLIVFAIMKLTEPKISGSIQGDKYVGKTQIYLDANSSILYNSLTYEHILEHVRNIARNNPNIHEMDINLIIVGDDGYGNQKTANWCHLIFRDFVISELIKYSDLDKMSSEKKFELIYETGISVIMNSSGDLDPRVFKHQLNDM